ncbi:MAG: hypothetical protein V7647_3297 [Acidobacteriota bacterium]|jgi:hypothetical protein
MPVKRANGGDIAEDEHREHDAGRGARAEEERENHHREQAHAGNAGLADADTGRADNGEQPLHEVQVRH